MARKRRKKAEAQQTAARVAEGIGEALASVVNRLESLEAEREKAYAQLVELQRRVNAQVFQFGRAIGQRVSTAATGPLGGRVKKRKKPTATSARRRRTTAKRKTSAGTIKCGICGTAGHNARGHAKWEASKRRKAR